jgi:hypothetical protein
MHRLGSTIRTLFLVVTLAWLVIGCGRSEAAEEPLPDLGGFGKRVSREVGQLAMTRFMSSAEAREQFLEVYPALHHRSTSEEMLADLEGRPELAPLAVAVRGVLEAELKTKTGDARRVRKSWNDQGVQLAVVQTVSGAMSEALATVSPGQAPSH